MYKLNLNFPFKELNVKEYAVETHTRNPLFMVRASEHGLFIPHAVKKNGMLTSKTLQYITNILTFPHFGSNLDLACIEENIPRYGWKLIKDYTDITQSDYISLPHAYKYSNLYTRMQVRTPDDNIIYVEADCIIDLLLNCPGSINKDTLEIDCKLFYDADDKTLKQKKDFEC